MAVFLIVALFVAAGVVQGGNIPVHKGILGGPLPQAEDVLRLEGALRAGSPIGGAATGPAVHLIGLAALDAPHFPIPPGGPLPLVEYNPDVSGKLPPNFLILPTSGFNWGQLHNYNAVDIANSCGTPVWAAADGMVITDAVLGDGAGWNGGYGQFVLLKHAGSLKTRYAHLEKILVAPGDKVKQGQNIGLMGQTGNATGCHLHFEVIGAVNPFAKS